MALKPYEPGYVSIIFVLGPSTLVVLKTHISLEGFGAIDRKEQDDVLALGKRVAQHKTVLYLRNPESLVECFSGKIVDGRQRPETYILHALVYVVFAKRLHNEEAAL